MSQTETKALTQKERIELWKLRLQLAAYAVGALILVSLVLYPPFMAKRVGDTFKALAANGVKVGLVDGKLSLAQEAGLLVAREQGAQFDLVRGISGCLVSNDCTPADRGAIVAALDLQDAQTYQAAQTNDADLPAWVAVLGADRSVEAARFELQKISNLSVVDRTGLVLRDGWYRTVAYFESADAANEALPALEAVIGNEGAYVRAMTFWCEGRIGKKDDEIAVCK